MSVHKNRNADAISADPRVLRRKSDTPEEASLRFTFDGEEICAYRGETIAAAVLGAGRRTLRLTSRRKQPRGLFCGMGVCFECLVQVDGRPNMQACQTLVVGGMHVQSQHGSGSLEQGQ